MFVIYGRLLCEKKGRSHVEVLQIWVFLVLNSICIFVKKKKNRYGRTDSS